MRSSVITCQIIGPCGIELFNQFLQSKASRTVQKLEKSDRIIKLRDADHEKFKRLCRQAFRWSQDNGEKVKATRPPASDTRLDRCGDNWFPVFSIALVVGREWYDKLVNAASTATSAGDESLETVLLSHLRQIVEDERGRTFFPTMDLLKDLKCNRELRAKKADHQTGDNGSRPARSEPKSCPFQDYQEFPVYFHLAARDELAPSLFAQVICAAKALMSDGQKMGITSDHRD